MNYVHVWGGKNLFMCKKCDSLGCTSSTNSHIAISMLFRILSNQASAVPLAPGHLVHVNADSRGLRPECMWHVHALRAQIPSESKTCYRRTDGRTDMRPDSPFQISKSHSKSYILATNQIGKEFGCLGSHFFNVSRVPFKNI